MATAVSHSFSLEPHHHPYFLSTTTPFKSLRTSFLTPKHAHPLVFFRKSRRCSLTVSFSTSHSSSSSTSSFTIHDPFRIGQFLTNEELKKLQFLENLSYFQELKSGSMWVRIMKSEEMDMVVALLADLFAEALLLPGAYVTLLGFLVKQYLIESRALMPHQ